MESSRDEEIKEVEKLRERVENLEKNVQDLAFCIQQIAVSFGSLVTHTTNQTNQSGSIDDYLDSLGKDDDDGTGYLH